MTSRIAHRSWSLVVSAVLLALVSSSPALAQGGGGGYAADMWNYRMYRDSMFVPHLNICDGTESFVSFTSDGKGFCIEEDQRSADTWEDARQDCFSEDKRLPEPGEFKYACRYGTGLNNMTDGHEWASNSPMVEYWPPTPAATLIAPIMGNGNCSTASHGFIANSNGVDESFAYRCVR